MSDATDIAISCACGSLRGTLHCRPADPPRHLVCYCDDCQAFAHAP